MRAKEFLPELNMAPGHLEKFALTPTGKGIIAGFEAEVIIPGHWGSIDEVLNYENDEQITRDINLREIRDFFNLSRNNYRLRTLEREYDDYVKKNFSEYFDDRIDDVIDKIRQKSPELDDDELRSMATDQIQDWYQNYDTPDLYDYLISIRIRTFMVLAEYYNFDWPLVDEDTILSQKIVDLKDNIRYIVNSNVIISSKYHGEKKDDSSWYLEPDESIKPANESTHCGVEIISPPMPVNVMLDKLSRVLALVRDTGGTTNNSTGFHVGVSFKDANLNKVNYLKLVLFLGDQYVLEQFGRVANNYAASALSKAKNAADAYNQRKAEVIDAAIMELKKGLANTAANMIQHQNATRYMSVNLKESYVEFRSMGNDYLNHYDAIRNTVLRYVKAYAVACNPEAAKKEYMKKLSLLLNPGQEDDLNIFVRCAMEQISTEQLIKVLKNERQSRNLNTGSV
jgi:hypothetical protein